jgi:hypothetical protein
MNKRIIETGVIQCPLNPRENTRPAAVIVGAPMMPWNQSTWYNAATVVKCASLITCARIVVITKVEK